MELKNILLYAPNNMAFGRFLMSAGYNDIDKVPTSLLNSSFIKSCNGWRNRIPRF